MGSVIGAVPDKPEARFVAAAVRGDAEAAIACFAADPSLDDPDAGAISGADAIRDYVAGLTTRLLADDVDVEVTGVTSTDRNSATEVDVTRHRNGKRVVFPAVLVSDIDEGTGKALAIRVYYRRVNVDDTRSYRRFPILTEERPGNTLHPVVSQYVEVLKHRDTAELVSMFDEKGSFNMWRGHEELTRVFDRMFGVRTHGVHLEHPNAFFDGTTTCIEFNSYRAEGEPPHPGVALYQVGDSGKLISARPLDE